MNIWWGAVTGFEIISFRRGEWERRLLTFIAESLGVRPQEVDPRLKTAMVLPFLP